MSIGMYVGGNVRSDLGEVEVCRCFKEKKCEREFGKGWRFSAIYTATGI